MKKYISFPLAALLSIVLIFGVCYAGGPKEILIGACEPATGVFSGFATGGIFGEKAAVEDINRLGGVYVKEYGRRLPVKLIVVNNESNPAKAGTLAESLILRDKVHLLISGPAPATVLNSQAFVAERHKIPYISGFGPVEPWQAARQTADPPWEYTWGYGFGIVTPPPAGYFHAGEPGYTVMETWFGVQEMFGDRTNKTVAVIASDDPDARGWYALFPSELEKRGYNVIGEEKKLGLHPIGTTDFSAMIKEWKAKECEILWGCLTAPDFGTMWRQAHALGWVPKMALIGTATLFYEEVVAWGGDLPLGIGAERIWDCDYPPEYAPGIGGTTGRSLFERWVKKTGKPLNQGMGYGYHAMQVAFDAIERAGTLDGTAINKAIGETDMRTVTGRAVFSKKEHHCWMPLAYGQWQKTDKPWKWENPIVFSHINFVKPTSTNLIFPIPTTTFK